MYPTTTSSESTTKRSLTATRIPGEGGANIESDTVGSKLRRRQAVKSETDEKGGMGGALLRIERKRNDDDSKMVQRVEESKRVSSSYQRIGRIEVENVSFGGRRDDVEGSVIRSFDDSLYVTVSRRYVTSRERTDLATSGVGVVNGEAEYKDVSHELSHF